MTVIHATLRALSNRSVAAAELGFAAFTLVLHGAWIALLVYAFDQGGVAETGVVAFAVLVPGGLAAPFVAVAYDRLSIKWSLAVGFLVQGLALAVVAIAIAVNAPAIVVYGAMMAVTVCQMASRPTMSAILPRIVHDPVELSAANTAVGVIETIGLFLGPSLAGLILFTTENRSVPFAVSALAMIAAGAAATTIEQAADVVEDPPTADSLAKEVKDGLRLLAQESNPRQIVTLIAASKLVTGALEVAIVAIAIDLLNRSEATAGLLGSALGVGAIVGSALSFLLIGRRRLSFAIAISVFVISLPLVLMSQANALAAVVFLLVLSGSGRPVLDVAGRTMLQGLSADDTLARIFGVLEGLSYLALAVGSIGFAVIANSAGLPAALVAIGLVPLVALPVQYTKLRRIDQARPKIAPNLLAMVRQMEIFAPLPAFQLEQMLLNMHLVEIQANILVFEKGADGDRVYLIGAGSAVIELNGRSVETGKGGFFGEIALLRDQPRMAAVRAGANGLQAYTLERDVFLNAISATNKSLARTHRIVDDRIGET